jgi:hypothetical protein
MRTGRLAAASRRAGGLTVTLALLLFTLSGRTPMGAAPVEPGSRIPWQGGAWYLHGANLPWYNWACDFGCGAQGGVSDPAVRAALEPVLRAASAAGMRVVRWWMFEGGAKPIQRDADGAPAGLDPTVYADIDAALALADEHDLYFIFTLFAAPSDLPLGWLTDPAQRVRLAEALAPLFGRYRGQPRLLAWDLFNEPEWDIWNHKVSAEAVQATVRELAATVHAQSDTYVTLGSAMLDGLPLWVGQGLDYYTAHWYDYMSGGNWCALCTDYAAVRARYGLDAPLVIGEFYAGPDASAGQRFTAWYDKGYAGALAWSLVPERTFDRMAIDLGAAAAFAAERADTGPRAAAPSREPN